MAGVERAARYSDRNAMTGSTHVARRAGIQAASAATTIIATAPSATGNPPPLDRFSIAVAASRVPQNATGAPTTSPATTSVSALAGSFA